MPGGGGLQEANASGPSAFQYILAGVIHQPVNLSGTEPVEALVAPTTAEEAVVAYPLSA